MLFRRRKKLKVLSARTTDEIYYKFNKIAYDRDLTVSAYLNILIAQAIKEYEGGRENV